MVQITAATLTQGPVCLRHRRSISHKLNKKDSNKDITPSPFSATNNHTGVVVNHELWSDRHWPGSGRPDVTGTGRAQDTTDSEQKGTLQPREREPEARQYHQRASKETPQKRQCRWEPQCRLVVAQPHRAYPRLRRCLPLRVSYCHLYVRRCRVKLKRML